MIGKNIYEANFFKSKKQYLYGIEWFHSSMGIKWNPIKATKLWPNSSKVFYTDAMIL